MKKPKLYINMTTKEPFQKQIIVSMGNKNIKNFMKSSSKYIININQALKGVKSNTFVNFIHIDYYGLIIMSNQVVSLSDLNIVKKYIKSVNFVDSNNIQTVCLL